MTDKRTTHPPPFDVPTELPWLADTAKQTVRLHPRRADDLALDESKMGGPIIWPIGEEWPICSLHGSAYVPVLQLRAEDLPEMQFPEGTDLFQLLWCLFDHKENGCGPLTSVFWIQKSDTHETVADNPQPSPDAKEFYLPSPCRLHPEQVTEYPDEMELSDNDGEKITESEYKIGLPTAIELLGQEEDDLEEMWEDGVGSDLYNSSLACAPGTKIGGYVSWIQDPEVPVCKCGNPMAHLLTIASTEFDGGTYKRWCPIEDEQVWTADWREREAVQAAADLMLGDMGSVYVFVCRNCQPWRIASVMQFS